MTKKIYLILFNRFPAEKAASLFAAKSAEAFAKEEGVSVTLVVPRRFFRSQSDPYSYYDVERNFSVVYVPVLDLLWLPFLHFVSFWIGYITFSVSTIMYLLVKSRQPDVVYSNESLPLFLASFVRQNTFYEMHDFPESKFGLFRVFMRRMKWILAHNSWKKRKAIELFGLRESNILMLPNAVDIKKFHLSLPKEEVRAKLGLPMEKKIVVYTGHLYEWKGGDTLALATHELPEDYLVVFVGGARADIERVKAQAAADKVLFVGVKPHGDIPMWQAAADVLVLPNSAKEKISAYYTSPMKLFEYMASERPIVASKIPSIEEIITDKEVFFVESDDQRSLAHGIIEAVTNHQQSTSKTGAAFQKVQLFDWSIRAQKILEFIEK